MKSITFAILMMMFAFNNYADNQQRPTDTKDKSRFLVNTFHVDGKKNPEKMPKYVLMGAFIGKVLTLPDVEYGLLIRSQMFNKTGLQQSTIETLLYHFELASADEKRLGQGSPSCGYINSMGHAVTKQGMAQAINQHAWVPRKIYADFYHNLEQIIPADEATKLRNYLSKQFVKNLTHMRSKDVQAKDVDLRHYFKRCDQVFFDHTGD